MAANFLPEYLDEGVLIWIVKRAPAGITVEKESEEGERFAKTIVMIDEKPVASWPCSKVSKETMTGTIDTEGVYYRIKIDTAVSELTASMNEADDVKIEALIATWIATLKKFALKLSYKPFLPTPNPSARPAAFITMFKAANRTSKIIDGPIAVYLEVDGKPASMPIKKSPFGTILVWELIAGIVSMPDSPMLGIVTKAMKL
jgi:hypothetical protein